MNRSDELLKTREARGLVWSIGGHLAVASAGIAFGLLHLVGAVEPGVIAETDREAAMTTSVLLATIAFGAWAWRQARAERNLDAVGISIALVDVTLIALLPVLWLHTSKEPDLSPAFLMKNELFTVSVAVIIINTLSLRPRYPIIVSLGALAVHGVVALLALSDPRVQTTSSFIAHFNGPEVNVGLFQSRMLALALCGLLLALIAKSAREAIKQGVALELVNYEIREEQARLIMEGKMAAMGSLVAGIAHEINTPLGAARSSLDNAARGASKLQELVSGTSTPDSAKIERITGIMQDNKRVGGEAMDRIAHLVDSLKTFAHVDEAEVQRIHLRDALEGTLTLIDNELKGDVRVQADYAAQTQIVCRPKEVNQIFMTIMLNAFEAMAGSGILTLAVEDAGAVVSVVIGDTGPGMEAAQVEQLFDIGFATKQTRVGMGLGLPNAKRIVEAHGGRLEVESAPGDGTRFRVTLPKTAAT